MADPETFEAVFCRIASEVVRDENLASLTKTMHPDLFRFIHVVQQRLKMENVPVPGRKALDWIHGEE